MEQRGWRLAVKRTADVSLAAAALALSSPALGAAALAVRVAMGRPVLFSQSRPGRNGDLFTVYKLRTMTVGTGSDAARLTPLGRLLRATSLDELPQLWNVLRGDMSLVGPRPLLVSYLERYSPEQRRRHDVLPGITGWAQINGRNTVTHEEKFKLDVWYVDHWSLALDARILAGTLWRVLSRSGISADGHVTMPEFKGTPLTSASDRA
ncbi:MAG TPA: sugar transferase [Polyangia bacterium]|jgi:lipopolysaccharide/colanic/teichoic acid biosynthesis glycosyltransferase